MKPGACIGCSRDETCPWCPRHGDGSPSPIELARREGYAKALKDVREALGPVLAEARGWKMFDRVFDVIDRIEKGEK